GGPLGRPREVGLPIPGAVLMDPFRVAARAYLGYGVVYWLGGFYLALHGVGIRGGRMVQSGVVWIVLGLVFIVLIPYLLAQRRAWFDRWILSRRDFARVRTALIAVPACSGLEVGVRPEARSRAGPGGGGAT